MSRPKPWCWGCETPPEQRVYLPEGWKKGDPTPEGVTVHNEAGRPNFVFLGGPFGERIPVGELQ